MERFPHIAGQLAWGLYRAATPLHRGRARLRHATTSQEIAGTGILSSGVPRGGKGILGVVGGVSDPPTRSTEGLQILKQRTTSFRPKEWGGQKNRPTTNERP